ncbi:hypothetical protein DKT68_13330 [Micromonospora acroterricola]|uniref:Uncharacterized protein n=1 Tax=Micromonospora acroterricola TaxID=2202421 RepID=A0A317D3R9_9ACTN|nr:hypothetical protein [Micromonospora acroterricola]PWR08972.1 hypothetical protein DKT68_13330 [Micromonospora acroterricola]
MTDPAQRPRALLETGWIALVAIWFWARAATADYWRREPVDEPWWRDSFGPFAAPLRLHRVDAHPDGPGFRPYFEIRDGKVYLGTGHPDGPRSQPLYESSDS